MTDKIQILSGGGDVLVVYTIRPGASGFQIEQTSTVNGSTRTSDLGGPHGTRQDAVRAIGQTASLLAQALLNDKARP